MDLLYDFFMTSFEKGGSIMWPILLVSVVSWFIGLERLVYMINFRKARKRFLYFVKRENYSVKDLGDPFYNKLLAQMEDVTNGKYSYQFVFREFLIFSADELDKGFSTMKAWISTAPLLGLLGTVAGMIHTFHIITKFGIDNPHLMAEGISIALITTQAGLTVAFPAMLFRNYLMNKKSALLHTLQQDGEILAKRFSQDSQK